MHLFTTQLNDIQTQIEALEAERNRLQELENATAGALANLKAVVANIKGDKDAITALNSAVMDLFTSAQDNPELVQSKDATELETSVQQFGTSKKPCPATTDGKCLNPECEGETFTCEGCGQETPYCFGGDADELCNDCWSKNPPPDPETDDLTKEKIQYIKELRESLSQAETVTVVDESDEPKEASAPRFKKMFDSEPEPDDFDVVLYSDQVNRDQNTLNIHFKLKRDAKKWAEQFELKYHDCLTEIIKDEQTLFKYVLKVTKREDDPQWWETITSYDYSKSPIENSAKTNSGSPALENQPEKYHILVQKDEQTKTHELGSMAEVDVQSNFQYLVRTKPDSYISLMSNKRGCVESHKPAVHQTLPHIDLSEEAINSEFTFIATGMGWQKVIHDGEVLGPIYSNNEGWELETGEKFATREEAAQALFQSTPSAA